MAYKRTMTSLSEVPVDPFDLKKGQDLVPEGESLEHLGIMSKKQTFGGSMSKIFFLNRVEDESGISGTGRIAQGVIFDNGKVALTWLSEHPSVTIYDNIGEVRAVHGHEGKTDIEMEPDWKRSFQELKSAINSFSLLDSIKDRLPSESKESKNLLDQNTQK
jgi:hypothetical protein